MSVEPELSYADRFVLCLLFSSLVPFNIFLLSPLLEGCDAKAGVNNMVQLEHYGSRLLVPFVGSQSRYRRGRKKGNKGQRK
jgi:hypothetical protein